MWPYMRSPNPGKDTLKEDREQQILLWCADKMMLPQKVIYVLERDTTYLESSDGETEELEYSAGGFSHED